MSWHACIQAILINVALLVSACQTTNFNRKSDAGLTGQGSQPTTDGRSDKSPCAADEECASGACVPGSDGNKLCAARCNTGLPCASGELCTKSDPRNLASPFVCVAVAAASTCAPCNTDNSCSAYGSVCMQSAEGKVCGIDCTLDGDAACPSGHSCVTLKDKDGNETAKQCVPQSGVCFCSGGQTSGCTPYTPPVDPGPGTPTNPTNPMNPVTPVPGCTPTANPTEICDGIDNDCNGSIDKAFDGAVLKKSCGVGLGVCVGEQTCTAGQWSACTAPAPTAETCDGVDQDCDGTVDNGVNDSVDSCGSSCMPCGGGANATTTLRECVPTQGTYACVIRCRGVNYNADGDLSNGCETPDDADRSDSTRAHAMGTVSDENTASQSVTARFPADDTPHEVGTTIRSGPVAENSVDWYWINGEDTWGDDMEFGARLDVRNLPPGNVYEICMARTKDSPAIGGWCGERAGGALTWQNTNGCSCAMGGNMVDVPRNYDYDPWVPHSWGTDDSGQYFARVRWVSGTYVPGSSGGTYTLTISDDR